jgi:iron complex outermembrane recepter protein
VRLLSASVALLGILCFSAGAIADAGGGADVATGDAAGGTRSDPGSRSELEEVIVTATRSQEAVSRIPISVQAFTKEDMEMAGVKGFEDLVRLSPGLTFNDTFAGGTNIAIRGIGSNAGSATTGIYIDDVPIQVRNLGYSATTIFPRMFDLDRVEVLRGPQGTLFGAGSEGGTVRFILPKPSLEEYDSFTRAEIGDTTHGAPSYELGEAVGGPIIPGTLGFRVSVYFRHAGGYIDRVAGSSLTVVDPTGSLRGAFGAAQCHGHAIPQFEF